MKIAVIGAGLSGLTAAIRLQEAGHEVVVLEANDYPGGRCKTFERDGFVVDTCPELAATSYRRWLNMIDEVGLGDQLVNSPTIVSMLQNGKLLDIDMGKLPAVALSPIMSWSAKFRFLKGIIGMLPQIRSVPKYLLDDISLDDPESNAQELSIKAFGREATEKLIEPLLRPIGGVTLDMMSTMLVPYTLSDWTQMVSLRGGLQTLPIAMARKLNIKYQATVKQVHSHADNVTIDLIDGAGVQSTLSVDKCLITIPFDQAEGIYPRLSEISNHYRDNMTFMRMFDIKLAYSKRPMSKAGMVMLSVKESPLINVISLSHNKSPDRAPEGHGLFSIFTEHKEFERMSLLSDDEVLDMIRQQVENLYPEVKGHFLFSYISRQHRVSYVPDAGFFHRTRALWDAIGKEPRVQLGGDIFMFGGLESAVASGERAAERLLKS